MFDSPIKIKITIKNDDQKFSQDFLEYGPIEITHSSQKLQDLISEAEQSFKGDPDEISLTFKYIWS